MAETVKIQYEGDIQKEVAKVRAAVKQIDAEGAQAGENFASGFTRGADGRLRDAKGHFVKAGQQAGEGFGQGFNQGAGQGGGVLQGSVGDLQNRIKGLNKEIEGLNNVDAIRGKQAEIAGLNKELDGLLVGKQSLGQKFGSSIKGAFAQFGPAALAMGGATLAIGALNTGLSNMLAKEDQLADFSAITGVTGDSLAEFGDIATGLSNRFGTSTVENIESFKGILSRLGPDIAKSSEAVRIMGEDVNILAKASGLDAPAAMDALTTSVLQFGVDLSDPVAAANEMTRMMNIMAAGAKEGAAEIPSVSEALKQAGATAKTSGLSFAETNSAIQILATAGKTGSEAGVGLRNVLVLMQKASGPAASALDSLGLSTEKLGATLQGPDGLANATAMLRDGLAQLETPAQRNAALVQIFGAENLVAAQALVANSDALRELTPKLEGTNTALDQAAVKSKTLSEKWNLLTTIAENTLVGALENLKGGLVAVTDVFSGLYSFLTGDFDSGMISFIDSVNGVTAALGLGKNATLEYAKEGYLARLEEKRFSEEKIQLIKRLREEGKTQEYITNQIRDVNLAHSRGTSVENVRYTRLAASLAKEGKSREEIIAIIERERGAAQSLFDTKDKGGGEQTGQTLKAMKERVSELTDSLTAANKASVMPQIKELEKQIAALEPPTKKAKAEVTGAAGSLLRMNKELSKANEELAGYAIGSDAWVKAGAKVRALEANLRTAKAAQDALTDGIKAPTSNVIEFDAKVTTSLVNENQIAPDLGEAIGEFDKFEARLFGGAEAAKYWSATVSGAFGGLGAMIAGNGEAALDSWKNIMKSVLNATVDAVEAEFIVAEAAALIKAIISGGTSLIADAPLKLAALVALETARGAINSLGSGGVLLEDQVIQAHAKETVIPFDKAPAFFASAVNQGAGQKSGTTREVYHPAWPQKSSARVQISTTSFGSGMDSLEFTQSRSAA